MNGDCIAIYSFLHVIFAGGKWKYDLWLVVLPIVRISNYINKKLER